MHVQWTYEKNVNDSCIGMYVSPGAHITWGAHIVWKGYSTLPSLASCLFCVCWYCFIFETIVSGRCAGFIKPSKRSWGEKCSRRPYSGRYGSWLPTSRRKTSRALFLSSTRFVFFLPSFLIFFFLLWSVVSCVSTFVCWGGAHPLFFVVFVCRLRSYIFECCLLVSCFNVGMLWWERYLTAGTGSLH